jgi:hypothetical protein
VTSSSCPTRSRARALDLVLAAHLLDEQFRVGADLDILVPVIHRPFQGREQAVVFGDVVRRDAQAAEELFDEGSVGVFDADAVTGRSGIAAGSPVDINTDHGG